MGSKVNVCQVLIAITNLPSMGLSHFFTLNQRWKGGLISLQCCYQRVFSKLDAHRCDHWERFLTVGKDEHVHMCLLVICNLCRYVHIFVFLYPVLGWYPFFLLTKLLDIKNDGYLRGISPSNWVENIFYQFSFSFWQCLWHVLLFMFWTFPMSMDLNLSVLITYFINLSVYQF